VLGRIRPDESLLGAVATCGSRLSQRGSGPYCAHVSRVQARRGAVTAAETGVVARAATARRRLTRRRVEGEGTRAVGGCAGKKRNGAAHRGGQTSVRWRVEANAAAFRRQRMALEGGGSPVSTLQVVEMTKQVRGGMRAGGGPHRRRGRRWCDGVL
jgi:hypothetical protein